MRGRLDPGVVQANEGAVRLVRVHRDTDEEVSLLRQRQPEELLRVLRISEELRGADEDRAVECDRQTRLVQGPAHVPHTAANTQLLQPHPRKKRRGQDKNARSGETDTCGNERTSSSDIVDMDTLPCRKKERRDPRRGDCGIPEDFGSGDDPARWRPRGVLPWRPARRLDAVVPSVATRSARLRRRSVAVYNIRPTCCWSTSPAKASSSSRRAGTADFAVEVSALTRL